ncbi:MAG TPA: PspC domain-containing protein [Candidatus Wirthbacteria bacterium]|nr:PspC domain-containing protein [Candidatus Wirthbacteria bacterium]
MPEAKTSKPQKNEYRRLYRSNQDKMIAGVCGGIAEYLQVDPSLVRLIWMGLTLAAGSGFVMYLVCWLVIPEQN